MIFTQYNNIYLLSSISGNYFYFSGNFLFFYVIVEKMPYFGNAFPAWFIFQGGIDKGLSICYAIGVVKEFPLTFKAEPFTEALWRFMYVMFVTQKEKLRRGIWKSMV